MSQYWFVEMGPIPGMPAWHTELYKSQSYPFPTLEAAQQFAQNVKREHWRRDVAIRHPDGSTEVIPPL